MAGDDEERPGKAAQEAGSGETYIRRLAALFAWLDQEHRISAELVPGEPPFFADPANLDAFAETLDATNWRTVVRPDARAFFEELARGVQKALATPQTEAHLARVRETKRIWEA